ncbi:threonine synthase [Longibacter salinarum]|uniref:Threonine synthase n=1 Tax=Longibacter salinarum TaxID=1850348 RepID=A0A2A8CXY5_9BACT|nr:threonine synthase [Longibacter salinarum]PEN13463.1 threonine synthase [Longibacter salinarum]
MQYVSTRTSEHRVPLSTALQQGLAPDGGLYVPASFPEFSMGDFDGCETPTAVAERMLVPFFAGDELEAELPGIAHDMYGFSIPLRQIGDRTRVLELFHGPTAAFKDVGARFLASSLSRLNRTAKTPLTILVATSGDTGAAVAAAFWKKPNVEVVVLYPKGRVSSRQEKQLTGWDRNVQTVAVRGVFDDCQRLVKQAFQNNTWHDRKRLSSANSINIGRLLPQMTYYAIASLQVWRETGEPAHFIVPSGNLGNALACIYARESGLPIGDVILATNANRPVTSYLDNGEWEPMETVETLATAMDVGNPSNMERLRDLYPTVGQLGEAISAVRVTDEAIQAQIRRGEEKWGEVWCPHTATAAEVRDRLDTNATAAKSWVMVATAHPAKFEDIVEPLVGHEVHVPDALEQVMKRAHPAPEIPPSLDALGEIVLGVDTPAE